MKRLLFFLVSVFAIFATPPARAAPSLRTTASAKQAEVGQGIRIELSALTDGDDSPSNPRLDAPPGFTVEGPSVSSSRQISFTNGRFESRHGISASWVVAGSRPGRFVVGPARVQVGASVMQGETIEIEILPQGAMPSPPQPRRRGLFDPMDPFDPFQGFPKLPGFDLPDEPPAIDLSPDVPPELRLDQAPDPLAFLHATVTPTHAVVGQQVTLRIYAFGSRGPFDEVGSSEPTRADFLSQAIVDSSYRQRRYRLAIGGEAWSAVKVREVALFPLKAGTLGIGPMGMGFRGRGYPDSGTGTGLRRQSRELRVVVTEPPLAGRPPGYQLGDVGRYTLSAEVEPRTVDAGGAVSVVVRIEGTGNIPRKVKLPEAPGVEWLDPTVTESVTATDGVIGGFRQLRFVVNLEHAGATNLGDVTLPYYDPRTRRYEVARASLGTVEVLPGAAPPAPAPGPSSKPRAESPKDPFQGLGGPRPTLRPLPPPPNRWTDRPWFWLFVLGGPLLVAALRGAVAIARQLRRRLQSRATSHAAVARRALDEARAAAGRREAAAVATAVERAIYTTVEDRLGLKARAVLRERLAAELEHSGAERALATETVTVLDACDGLRFGGRGEEPADVVARASAVVSRMARASAAVEVQRAP